MRYSNKLKERLKHQYGKWALITGASSGIGKELATRLAEAGLNLIISSRTKTHLLELAKNLKSDYTIKVEIFAMDLSIEENNQLLIDFTKPFDVGLIVLSAGFGTSGLFLESNPDEERNMLRLNCESLLILTQHFAQRFADKGQGGIILMSSIVGFQGVPYASHYSATKAYVQSLAEGLYHELKPVNVDVLAASPGPVNSGFADRAQMTMDNVLKPKDVVIPILKALGKQMTVFPGLLTKILIFGLRTVPRWGKIKIMKKVMGNMTNH